MTRRIRDCPTVLSKDQSNLQALLAKSTLLIADNKLDDALTTATFASKRHPDSTSAFFTLGRVQAARHQTDAAIAAYQEVLRLNPRATQAKIALAQLNLAQGRPDASIGFAQEALANEPQNGDAQLVFVRGLLARGDLDRAANELKQLTTRYPNSAAVHAQMGMLLGRRHDLCRREEGIRARDSTRSGGTRGARRARRARPDGARFRRGARASRRSLGGVSDAGAARPRRSHVCRRAATRPRPRSF